MLRITSTSICGAANVTICLRNQLVTIAVVKGTIVMARFLWIFGCLCVCCSSSSMADDYPCGPDGMPTFMKRLVPQTAFGADFRPACRHHDRCYSACGADRKQCDKQLKADMHCACENSKHPLLCRMAANHRYRMTRLFGGSAFRKSQR